MHKRLRMLFSKAQYISANDNDGVNAIANAYENVKDVPVPDVIFSA